MNSATLRRSACALAAALVASACMVTPRGSVNTYTGDANPRSTKALVGNPLLAANIEIPTASIVTARRNDLMVVQFDIVNRTSSQIGFQWTVDWLDRQGLVVPNATQHWEPMRLAGRASQTVSVTAPNAAAESWRLQIGSRDEVQ